MTACLPVHLQAVRKMLDSKKLEPSAAYDAAYSVAQHRARRHAV